MGEGRAGVRRARVRCLKVVVSVVRAVRVISSVVFPSVRLMYTNIGLHVSPSSSIGVFPSVRLAPGRLLHHQVRYSGTRERETY